VNAWHAVKLFVSEEAVGNLLTSRCCR